MQKRRRINLEPRDSSTRDVRETDLQRSKQRRQHVLEKDRKLRTEPKLQPKDSRMRKQRGSEEEI